MKKFICFHIDEVFYVVSCFYHDKISWLAIDEIYEARYFRDYFEGSEWAEKLCRELNTTTLKERI